MPVTPSVVPDLRPLMVDERARLLELLCELDDADWDRPTECPAWSVKGIALHLLGDDLSLLARQRDDQPSGLIAVAERNPGRSFLELLDLFNQGWVASSSFFSTALLVDLLRLTGEWTAAFYGQCGLEERGEPVFWLGPEPAPYRFIVAREYGERWIHHLQIGRATNHSGPLEPQFMLPAVDMALRIVGRFMGDALGERSALIGITVPDLHATWTIGPDSTGAWQAGRSEAAADVLCTIAASDVPACFSFGLSREQVDDVWTITGDPTLISPVRSVLGKGLTRR
jgi:uncharacterized protein (TIGR03083 family)